VPDGADSASVGLALSMTFTTLMSLTFTFCPVARAISPPSSGSDEATVTGATLGFAAVRATSPPSWGSDEATVTGATLGAGQGPAPLKW